MRTSSIKSFVSTFTLVITLTLIAAPLAEGRTDRESRSGRTEIIMRTVRNLLKRIGRVVITGGPSVPITEPAPGTGTDTTGTGETGQ